MTLHVRDAGSFKEVDELTVRDAGSWKSVQEAWVRDAGSWKQFFSAQTVVLTDRIVSSSQPLGGPLSQSRIDFSADGVLRTRLNNGAFVDVAGEWLNPAGPSTGYRLRATLQSGTTPSGIFGAWQTTLGVTARIYSLSKDSSSGGFLESVILFEIDAGDGVVLTSAEITLTTETII